MATVVNVTDKDTLFWQNFSGDEEFDEPGEPAILITSYSNGLVLRQGDDVINLSAHEVAAFIKELRRLNKAA